MTGPFMPPMTRAERAYTARTWPARFRRRAPAPPPAVAAHVHQQWQTPPRRSVWQRIHRMFTANLDEEAT